MFLHVFKKLRKNSTVLFDGCWVCLDLALCRIYEMYVILIGEVTVRQIYLLNKE